MFKKTTIRHVFFATLLLAVTPVYAGESVNAAHAPNNSSSATTLPDPKGDALISALEEKNFTAARKLINDGADVNYRSLLKPTPIMLAATEGDLDTVRLLVEKGAHVDDGLGSTNFEVLKFLISNGADINNTKKMRVAPPLQFAATSGNLELTRFLINNGSDVNANTSQGNETALLKAAAFEYPDLFKLLLDSGAKVDAHNVFGETALMRAAEVGHDDIIKMSIDRGADLNHKTTNGDTALMLAADGGHSDTVKLLIERGADPSAVDSNGKTALSRAEKKGHKEVADLLRAAIKR